MFSQLEDTLGLVVDLYQGSIKHYAQIGHLTSDKTPSQFTHVKHQRELEGEGLWNPDNDILEYVIVGRFAESRHLPGCEFNSNAIHTLWCSPKTCHII